jgi:GntR family transcriptional regulator, transcriptional repressor for pyruvate dehydrogenase complex
MAKSDNVAMSIGELISSEGWRNGHRLPTERQLCERFGTARNTVRRALLLLEREQRIIRHSGRGCFVLDATDDVAGGNFNGDVAKAGLTDILELRLIVEPQAAGIAAIRATASDLAEIERSAARIVTSPDLPAREQSDAYFHEAIFKATRNPLLLSLCEAINKVRDQAEWLENKHKILSRERRDIYDEQHARIVSGIKRRSAEEARVAMRSHLETLERDLLGRYLS